VKIAILDVDYRTRGARAACVIAEDWESATPVASCISDIEAVSEYEPGAFYRRELPCLLQVLGVLPFSPDVVVIDGYVWLADASRPGLGAHLYEALGGHTPVIGVAKTAFHGAASCTAVVQVCRGSSQRPLFVSAAGLDAGLAGAWVQGMAGSHRIPELLRLTDQLARS
jgi:deoxyribonuclease V